MKYHIGIVEDDTNIQNIVSAYLKKEGFKVELVSSAEEAMGIME